jgi:hypothetical protein
MVSVRNGKSVAYCGRRSSASRRSISLKKARTAVLARGESSRRQAASRTPSSVASPPRSPAASSASSGIEFHSANERRLAISRLV